MKGSILLTLCIVLVLLAPQASSFAGEFLLYAPKPAAGDQVPSSPDQGVLVRRVTVKRGDTLKRLSREHIGVASYFPQVLLFNTIKNPDLIYPGEKLLFPVSSRHQLSSKKSKAKRHHHVAGRHSLRRKTARVEQAKSSVRAATLDEQESYQRAKNSYLGGDYQKALGLFDAFLRRFPKSEFAADAFLYRADCYLHLSRQ